MNKKMGRPSKYESKWKDRLVQIEGWAKEGLTDKEIADKMDIGIRTLYEWKVKFPDFSQSLKKGKEVSDYEVERTLFKRALGYSYEETKIVEELKDGVSSKKVEKSKKQLPPDTTAIIFWLKNRKPEVWRDKKEIAHSGELEIIDKKALYDKYLSDENEQD